MGAAATTPCRLDALGGMTAAGGKAPWPTPPPPARCARNRGKMVSVRRFSLKRTAIWRQASMAWRFVELDEGKRKS